MFALSPPGVNGDLLVANLCTPGPKAFAEYVYVKFWLLGAVTCVSTSRLEPFDVHVNWMLRPEAVWVTLWR